MSLISKQIDALRAYAKKRKGELSKLISDAADTIELLSAKLHASQMERSSQYYHGGWIPCDERLPETEEQVLIYAWNVHYVLAKYKEIRTCDGVYKMAWVTEDAYSIPQEIKHEVICWRHLPEPYREEGDS